MIERENLPAVIATQAMTVLTEQRESLVGRGLVALKKDNDALYRQARVVFHRKNNTSSWNETDDPTLFSAFKTFQKLSAENFGKAYWPLSILYHEKRDIKGDQNPTQHYAQLAFDWCYENRANQDVELWRDLGNMFRIGWGVEQNDGEAVYWYHKAAEQGDSGGQFNLGAMYCNGEGVPQDYDEALKWFREAADQGDAYGQFNLGAMYSNGHGVPQDYQEAVKWFRKAADQGDADGQSNLGAMYDNGTGVPKDDDEAAKWYRLAAAQGNASAQYNLGVMYHNGHGVPQDYDEASKWYQLAANQGNDDAQFILGEMYREGNGVPKDFDESIRWCRLAAGQGHAKAISRLALLALFEELKGKL